MFDPKQPAALVSIGVIAREAGLPVSTIRTWERRYGFPEPIRSPSGHRRYETTIIPHLRLLSRAASQGGQIRNIIKLSIPELRRLIGASVTREDSDRKWLERTLDGCRSYDSIALHSSFLRAVALSGLLSFVKTQATQLIHELGSAWEEGRIEAHHEHFATECLRDFLAQQWRELSPDDGCPVVLGTLPGEQHLMGLHLVACICASYGYKCVFLGASLPLENLASVAQTVEASSLCVSISSFASEEETLKMLLELRQLLPLSAELWIGGSGAPDMIPNTKTFGSLTAFEGVLS